MTTLIECKGITKTFPGVVALDNISFSVKAGEVHCLVGENGAGKSTLMKILSGAYTPTKGTILANDKEYSSFTPRTSRENGISIIYQELSVIDTLNIQENIFVGQLPTKNNLLKNVDYNFMAQRTEELLDAIGMNRKPTDIVGDLSISEKQMVEIAKAVAFDAKVIIMDEPTSSLVQEEINHLMNIVRKLTSEGRGIIYISHKLNEIKELADRITVLKDGSMVGTVLNSEVTEDDIVHMMVGREIKGTHWSEEEISKEVILSVQNLTRKDKTVLDASFNLYKGEVLGFSGLVGAGRTELAEAIYGAAPVISGEITLFGEKVSPKSPYEALKLGIGLVTESRRETGIAPFFSIKQNISQAKFIKNSGLGGLGGLLDFKEEDRLAEEQIPSLQVKCTSGEQLISQLSGGNQQKVILGRWLSSDPKLLIFDEPTKGIDVGTKSEIYKIMRRLCDQGYGVIVVSSEMPELLGVCDRIIVMSSGKITGDFQRAEASEEVLLKAASIH